MLRFKTDVITCLHVCVLHRQVFQDAACRLFKYARTCKVIRCLC